MEMDVILLVDHAQGWQEDLLMLFLIFVGDFASAIDG
jgi:hypothetical protein